MSKLREQENLARLLREILKKRSLSLALLVGDDLRKLEISDDDRLRVCDVLTEELCETGLNADSEPNARGFQIEALIDAVNPISRRKVSGSE